MLICSWLAGFGQPPVCIHHSLGDSPCIQLCNGVWLLVCGAKQVWYVQASTIGLYPVSISKRSKSGHACNF